MPACTFRSFDDRRPVMQWAGLLALCAVLLSERVLSASIISTFSDSNCQDSVTSLYGPNGYPNGTCTDIRRSGPYGSFQIVGLDPGCTVTLYMFDNTTDICGGFQDEHTQIAVCYNSTWAFYSIDFCDPAAAGSGNSTSSSNSQNNGSGSSSHTGAIVGGVVGGVLGLAAIIGATVYFTRRSVTRANADDGPPENTRPHVSEMFSEHAKELPVQPEVYEKTANSVRLPPVELPAEHYDRYRVRPNTPPT
ncbi:uncharacterized protein PV09_06783 [Verruconis gallopava]|uniref:Uncharacterized protein n=1 Tax=Verruconis gallopava TaxID=253628 RepID=A0A0D2A5Y7_9PEZI|nr:uncharacterized protein PV09_06783 [Verruconis gallopava]KIW01945.1 hypothetical protein PV09_06783 [Verruconis gallopava]